MSDLVETSEDRFSHATAHLSAGLAKERGELVVKYRTSEREVQVMKPLLCAVFSRTHSFSSLLYSTVYVGSGGSIPK